MSSHDSKQPAVPKFASFKPKPNASEAAASDVPSKPNDRARIDETKERYRRRRETRDDDRGHSKSKSHRHGRRRSRSEERHGARTVPLPRADSSRKDESSENQLFTVDKRGDPLIVRYGSNDRNRIPAYRRVGAGRILGAPGRITILRDGTKEVFSLGGNREGASAFRDRTYLAKVLRTRPRRFKQRPKAPDEQAAESDEEFVPLKQSRKRKRGQDQPNESSDEEQPNYRSIYGKPKAHEDSDSDLDDSSVTSSRDEEDLESQDPIKAKFIELSRRVKDHPGDIDSWLELAQAQETVLRLGEDTDAQSKDGAKGLANVKLSLYEEALPHAQSDADRERILLRLMREGSKVWSTKTLANRWAEVTKANEKSFALWKGRLNFELTNMTTFTFDGLREFHLERLHSLRGQLPKASVNFDDDPTKLCNELIYVFLRTTRFIYDAGFVELAVAAWQGILELTFARFAETYVPSTEEAMSSFKDFWESEVPRIGEDNAKGWQHFAEVEAMADLPEPKTDKPSRAPDTKDAYKAWASIEVEQTCNGKLPARTLDEGSEDDPYRVVMHSDIEPLIFYIPSAPASVKATLLDSFLLFCGVPPIDASGATRVAFDDPFVFRGGKAIERELTSQPTMIGHEPEDLSKQLPPFSRDGSHVAITSDVLFAGKDWFKYIVSWTNLYRSNEEPLKYDWIIKTVKQVALTFGFGQAAEYSLALSWNHDCRSSKKTAKTLLKQYSSSINLYNAYALAEWENGNEDLARNVYLSAASLQTTEEKDKQLLWNTWAWKELNSGERDQSLACFVSSIEESQSPNSSQQKLLTPPSTAQILKTRQKLLARRDYSLSSGNIVSSILFAQSLALLEYLTAEGGTESRSDKQGNISAAIESILAFSNELISRHFGAHGAHEQLLQFGARLLYFHASHGSVSLLWC